MTQYDKKNKNKNKDEKRTFKDSTDSSSLSSVLENITYDNDSSSEDLESIEEASLKQRIRS